MKKAPSWLKEARLDPTDDSLPPGIYQAYRQRQYEEDDLDISEETELLENHRPGDNEDDVYVEGDEEEREDIESQRILHPGRADRRLT